MESELTALPASFFERATLEVAQDLIGIAMVTPDPLGSGWVGGKIVEVEAYTDAEDPGSHSYRGRTPRNFLMFEQPGRAYVYFIYGNHYCFNIVAHPPGRAGAVLVRALSPDSGMALMLQRRGPGRERQLTNGPGKLCQALGIDKALNGSELFGPRLRLGNSHPPLPKDRIACSSRIGLSQGQDLPWRFFIPGNAWVSAKAVEGRPARPGKSLP